jgi:hypothetical protein
MAQCDAELGSTPVLDQAVVDVVGLAVQLDDQVAMDDRAAAADEVEVEAADKVEKTLGRATRR